MGNRFRVSAWFGLSLQFFFLAGGVEEETYQTVKGPDVLQWP